MSNPAAVPAIPDDVQGDGRWICMHQRFIMEAKEGEPDVLFVGDSLVCHLAFSEVWKTLFAPLHCLNFGVGGDQTQHVLWRLSNGELDNIRPKVVVLLVGTNNHGNTPEQIAEGIEAIVNVLREKQPQAFIIVLGLLPRGQYPNPLRERNQGVNRNLTCLLAPVPQTQFVAIDPGFVQADGTISHHDMYDYLHLTPQGYSKAMEPVYDLLLQILHGDAEPILELGFVGSSTPEDEAKP